jgi:hypothetical protein
MRPCTSPVALGLIGAGLLAGCSLESIFTEPGATTVTAASLDLEARRHVDHVRLGSGLDREGQVPIELVTGTFASGCLIYMSMEVTDALAGSRVRVTLLDKDTTEPMWSEEQSIPSGRSYVAFNLGDRLPRGSYRAQLIIGDETVARREFEIVERST